MPEIAHQSWVKVKLAAVSEENPIADDQEVPADGKKPVIAFRFETVDPVLDKNGKTIEPGKLGSFLTERVYLRDKNNLTSVPERAVQQIGRIQDALDNTGDADNTEGKPPRVAFDPNWVAASIGKLTMAFVIIDGEYGNKIKEVRSLQDKKFNMV